MIITRVTSEHPDFKILANELELDLKIRDGEQHLFYSDLNKIGLLKHAVVSYDQAELTGCGAFTEHTANTVEIKRMFVRSTFRGRGVATSILRELEKRCAEKGFKTCVLETGKNQPEAIAFYEKEGYDLIPNFGKYVGSENSVCFKKTIS